MRSSVLSIFCLILGSHLCAQYAGDLDSTFADSGYVILHSDVFLEHAQSLLLQPDGRIIISGTAVWDGNDLGAARMLNNGEVDNSFGTDGATAVNADNTEFSYGSVLQADGRSLFAGSTHTLNPTDKGMIVRLDTAGHLDPTFASTGVYTLEYPGESTEFQDLAVQSDGRIIGCGQAEPDMLVHRLMPNGTPDPSFGDQGSVRLQYNNMASRAQGIALLPDGMIIVAGTGIVRLQADGELDAMGFGVNGWAQLPTDLDTTCIFEDVLVQPDGRILATGRYQQANSSLVVVRLLPNGMPDNTFALDGSMIFTYQDASVGMALALQDDGRILVTGSTDDWSAQTTSMLLLQVEPTGELDVSFGQNGVTVFSVPMATPHIEIGTDVVVQPDGRILVSMAYWGSPMNGFLVARFLGRDISTAYTSIEHSLDGRIYPNPANEKVTIECPICSGQPSSLTLFDANGRTIRQIMKSSPELDGRTTIAVEDLDSGMYALRVNCAAGQATYRVLVGNLLR